MSNIKIAEQDQRVQYTATGGQTNFAIPFVFFDDSDIVVYQDSTKLTLTTNYTLSGAGNASGGTLTLTSGATSGDIITIFNDLAIDRTSIYSATISNLTGSDLNQDFNREVVMMSQIDTTQRLLQLQYAPYAEVSQDDTVTTDRWIPRLSALEAWRMNSGGTAIETFTTPSSGGLAPDDATYITQTSNSDLSNEQAIGDLSSGILIGTNSTGVILSRVLTGTTNEVNVTNGSGIGGNPTVGIADNPVLPGNEGTVLPKGTTAQRPGSPTEGEFRYNETLNNIEVYNGTDWITFSDGGVVDSIVGTANQIDVDTVTDPQNPVISLPTDLQPPGTITMSDNIDMQQNDLLDVRRIDFNTAWRLADEAVGGVQRLLLRAQTGNQDAEIALSPIGTATQSRFVLTDNANLVNFSSLELTANSSASAVNSAQDGSGTLKPLELQMDDVAAFEIKTNGTPGAKSNRIEDVADPTGAQDAATKAYVDSRTDLNFMESVLAASTSNFASTYDNGSAGVGATLTANSNGAFTLDGESGVQDARYLMKDQTASEENGIYTLTQVGDGFNPAILTRATDFDQPSEIDAGDIVPVLNGTDNAATSWLQTATVNTIGTDAITFTQWSADFANVMTLDGTQTITGDKTFSGNNDFGTPDSITLTNADGLPVSGLANGTDGELITWDATGAPATVAVGSAGEVLTSNGAGAAPTFQAAAGGTTPPKEITYLPGSFESLQSDVASLELLLGSNLRTMVRAFDDTTQEFVSGKFVVPGDVDTGGTVTFRTYSMAKTAASSKNVEYTFEHLALNDAEDFDPASPYTSEVSGDLPVDSTQDNIQEDTWTETVANLGWAANDIVLFRLSRTAPSANDLSGDLFLFSFTIEIPRS